MERWLQENNAGEGYNSWPLMNGELVPTAYDSGTATFDTWTKNNAAIQFNHRTMATVTMLFAVAMTVIALMRIGRTLPPYSPCGAQCWWLGGCAIRLGRRNNLDVCAWCADWYGGSTPGRGFGVVGAYNLALLCAVYSPIA